MKPFVAQRHKVWLYRLVVDSIPTRGNEIFIYIYIFISSLWCGDKARRWVPPINMQCLQNSAKSRKRTVLILASLCLPFCVRYTAWSWFWFNYKWESCWATAHRVNVYITGDSYWFYSHSSKLIIWGSLLWCLALRWVTQDVMSRIILRCVGKDVS